MWNWPMRDSKYLQGKLDAIPDRLQDWMQGAHDATQNEDFRHSSWDAI